MGSETIQNTEAPRNTKPPKHGETLLALLADADAWQAFLLAKEQKNQLTKRERAELRAFIEEKAYPSDVTALSFGLPAKKQIGRLGSEKKRTVYTYSPRETLLLKALAFHLYRYDGAFSDSCYSFRQHRTAQTAVRRVLSMADRHQKYILKADIRNYFNSIDVPILLRELEEAVGDDRPLYALMEALLTQDACTVDGETVREKRGAMAGVPLSGFFANVYLRDWDAKFEKNAGTPQPKPQSGDGTPEAYEDVEADAAAEDAVFARLTCLRYADDILILADSREDRDFALAKLEEFLRERKLELNSKKMLIADPGTPFDFLGFSFSGGEVDLAAASIRKMKDRIRRKAHRLWRKRTQNGLSWEKAARAMIRGIDSRLYDLSGTGSFSWTRYFFPVLTTDKGLHEIDTCMLQYLRYLADGRHHKKNYRIRYEDIRRLGYTPLVREYYTWQEEERKWNGGQAPVPLPTENGTGA